MICGLFVQPAQASRARGAAGRTANDDDFHDSSFSRLGVRDAGRSRIVGRIRRRPASTRAHFLRLRRRLDAERERFGVGHLDLVALLDDLELIGVAHVERHDVAARPLERDRALLRVDADDVGDRGDLARAGSRRRLAGLRSHGALAHGRLPRLDLGLPQLERERLGVARDDEVAELDLVEVLDLVARDDVDDVALRPLQRHRARRLVDADDLRGEHQRADDGRPARFACNDGAPCCIGLLRKRRRPAMAAEISASARVNLVFFRDCSMRLLHSNAAG